MAVQLRRPGGGWMRVTQQSDYSNVVSQYGEALQRAIREQENLEIQNKVFDYEQGNITFAELQTFLNDKLSSTEADSSKHLELRQLLSRAQEMDTNRQRETKRAQLEAKFAKDGISASERVEIEQGMLEFYKPGTPEYSQQIAIIAQAEELAVQEAKNVKLAQLKAQLSVGGLSTKDQISLYQQARELTEPGTVERAQMEERINLLSEQARQEEAQRVKDSRLSQLLDELTPGGMTNEKLLTINREMIKFEEPGTAAYNELKMSEAKLLAAIAAEKSSGGATEAQISRELVNQAKISFADIDKFAKDLEQRYSTGQITVEQYLQGRNEVVRAEEAVLEGVGDLVTSNADLANQLGRRRTNREILNQQQEDLASGNLISIVDKSGKQTLITPDATSLANMATKQKIVVTDAEGNRYQEDAKTIKMNVGGTLREFRVRDDGSLEVLGTYQAPDGSTHLQASGETFDPRGGVSGADPRAQTREPGAIQTEPRVGMGVTQQLTPERAAQLDASREAAQAPQRPQLGQTIAQSAKQGLGVALGPVGAALQLPGQVRDAKSAISNFNMPAMPSMPKMPSFDFSAFDSLMQRAKTTSPLSIASMIANPVAGIAGAAGKAAASFVPQTTVSSVKSKVSGLVDSAKSFVSGIFGR